jgi:hypothetical protein
MFPLLSHEAAALTSPRWSPGSRGVLILYTPAGTNEQAIIDVLTKRSNAQRQQIAKSFKAQFGKVRRCWGCRWGQLHPGGDPSLKLIGNMCIWDILTLKLLGFFPSEIQV